MATAALFLAIGGGAYAASSLAPNSVGTAQIKNAAVTAAKLHVVPGASVSNSANEAIPHSATTSLTFDTPSYNNAGVFNVAHPDRLTAPIAGVYEVTGSAVWTDLSDGTGERSLFIVVNGTTVDGQSSQPTSTNGKETVENVAAQVRLTAGGFVQLDAYQGGDQTVNITAGSHEHPTFAMTWLGP